MRILIAGTGALGMAVMEPLLASRHKVVGLLLNGRKTRGALGRYAATSWFGFADGPVGLAREKRVPVFWLDRMTPEALAPLASVEPDLLITCGFGIILKPPLLSLPAIGCMNVHSSLLPKHRGPMPFNWAILAGDAETGVTFHVTSEAIDAGDIVEQRAIALTNRDSSMSVYQRCCDEVRRCVLEVVDRIDAEGLRGTPQDESLATYDKPLSESDLTIDWSRPADEIDRLVRAGSAQFPARFFCRSNTVYLARTSYDLSAGNHPPGTVLEDARPLRVATGHGVVSLLQASVTRPILWPWPSVFSHPKIGDTLGP